MEQYGYSSKGPAMNNQSHVQQDYFPKYENKQVHWSNHQEQAKKQNQDIPEEFRDDPEMYYAIQASLGLDANAGGNDIEDLGAWDDKGQQSGFGGPGASRQKTPSTGDNLSNKNNNSMDSDQLFHCEDDDELGFTNYN